MSLFVILGIAVGLSMDAFAVSISYGCSASKVPLKHTSMIALAFGGFQAFMPLLGWYGGTFFADYIKSYDHWIAFTLLTYVGAKMIVEGIKGMKDDENSCTADNFVMDYRKLFILAVATSIDALAVGLSLSLLGVEIFYPSAVIGLTTFTFSFAGVRMGCRLKDLFGKRVEIAGGIILLIIGVKILSDHIF